MSGIHSLRQLTLFWLWSSLCLCVSVVSSSSVVRADWPIFRGNPAQTGVAASDLPAELAVRWKFKTGDRIDSTAAIVNGVVYIGSFDEHLYAINLADGNLKWKRKLGPIMAAPAVKDGFVYVGDEEGFFHCLDAKTGEPKWKFETGGEIVSSANFLGDRVLFGSGDSHLYCLTTKGKEVWKFRIEGGPVRGSPALAGKQTFVSGCDNKLHVIDVESGREAGSVQLEGQTGSTPAVADNRVYLTFMQPGYIQAVDWKKGEVAWTYEPERSQQLQSSAAATDRLVIFGGRDKLVHALDRAKGTVAWTFPTKGRIDGSPVVVGNRVFIGSLDGNLYELDLVKGKELRRWELGRGVAASPAVADGCLVIATTDGVVFCLGK
ncbi:MAG: PQQ-binding-like beta-propeller repeat protein [Gemmataceae bacterium]|nr:PQQ-binding-like beta-propeller repeat protein [Gemmataceae bacterium]